MTDSEMWKLFTESTYTSETYEAWAFGADPDGLAELVVTGIKTSTSSAYPLYELEGESLPKEGEYSIILNSDNEAVCVIRTTNVYIVPFCGVSEQHAYKEGEGDRSLRYWRNVHADFFANCLNDAGLTFSEDMKVVCEEFEVVYK